MKVEINSNLFNDFVKKSKIVTDEFGGILVDATDVVELVKCDIENQVSREIQADIEEPGSVILPKEVFPLIKNDSLMTILDDEIIIGSRVIKLELKNIEGYPRVDGDFNSNVFNLSDKELKQLLEVEHAISQDQTKPILTGIRIDGNKFVALDGYRLCERVGPFQSETPITISNHKMLKALRGNIKATHSDKYIKYQVGDLNFYNRLIGGDFIEVDKLKPKEHNVVLEIDKNNILDVLNSMNKVSSGNKNQLVMFNINENLIHIIAKNEKISLEDSVTCNTLDHYEDLKIGFNCKYLIESIKNMDGIFKMSFTTSVNPVIVESPGKYELILPVRVRNI